MKLGRRSVATRAVVVAQLVERSLLTPEIRSLNPNIGKVLPTNCKLNVKDENKEKEAGNGPSLKKLSVLTKLFREFYPWQWTLSSKFDANFYQKTLYQGDQRVLGQELGSACVAKVMDIK